MKRDRADRDSGDVRFLVVLRVSSSSALWISSLEWYKVYESYIRARLGTAAHLCEVVVLKLSASGGEDSAAADARGGAGGALAATVYAP